MLPTEIEFFDQADKPFLVRYDYDRGEDQWFDARQGVGSPGYPPSACVTEINYGDGWRTPDAFPWLDMDMLDNMLMEKLADLEADEHAARAEAEYDAWQDAKRWSNEQ